MISALLLEARLTVGSVSAEAALRRVELAELALTLVDTEVVPRTARPLTRDEEIQRTCCLWLRAEIYQYLGQEDEVLATWRGVRPPLLRPGSAAHGGPGPAHRLEPPDRPARARRRGPGP